MPPKKDKDKPANAANAAMMAKVRAAIEKKTGMKPLRPGSQSYTYVSTGSFSVDMLIGGTKTMDGKGLICPGFPRRRITEVYGAESSGKTTLLISAMVQAQHAGGKAMLVDYEHSIDLTYAQKLGLSMDEDKMVVYQPDTMESGFMAIYAGILGGFDIIGVDSVAAMVPEAELSKGFDEAAKIGAVAAKFSRELPKFAGWLNKHPMASDKEGSKRSDTRHPGTALVFVNQIRAVIQTGGYSGGGGDNENTSGGKALKFYAYERLRLTRIRSESIEKLDAYTGKKKKYPYGNVTDVKVIKSKIDAKQGHSTQIFIRFGTGIDDYFSIIETGVTQKLIRKDGGGIYRLGDKQFKGRDALRKHLQENEDVFQTLRTRLAQLVNEGAVASDEPEDDDAILEALDTSDDDDGEDLGAAVEEVVHDSEGDQKGEAAE
jgi:recombination protein RecA